MTGHDPKCPHSNKVRRILDPLMCSFCEVIRNVRAEYTGLTTVVVGPDCVWCGEVIPAAHDHCPSCASPIGGIL